MKFKIGCEILTTFELITSFSSCFLKLDKISDIRSENPLEFDSNYLDAKRKVKIT